MEKFQRLVDLTKRLRRECPWDREQTHETLGKHLVEETYEVLDAISSGVPGRLRDELGDVLLQVLFHANIAEERGEFGLSDVAESLSGKLIARHPHIFGTGTAGSAAEVKQNWERLKMREGRESVLDGVPPHLPALQYATRVQEKAASVGFDWDETGEVWKKVEEELSELRTAASSGDSSAVRDELGDLLFALVNYSRFIGVDAEDALRGTIGRFRRRFAFVESGLKEAGKTPAESSLEEMERLWQESKKNP